MAQEFEKVRRSKEPDLKQALIHVIKAAETFQPAQADFRQAVADMERDMDPKELMEYALNLLYGALMYDRWPIPDQTPGIAYPAERRI